MTPDRSSQDSGGEPLARSVMIAGEMLNWSDLHPEEGAPATGGPIPSSLLDAVLRPDHNVLVAGPHSLEVLALIAGRVTKLDVLVRSAPDAEEIADQLESDPVRVFCGSLDHFGPEHGEPQYDVVVALDGLPRLVGPDTLVLTWNDALAALKSRLAPEGQLLIGAANPFGIERLVLPGVAATVPSDEAWPRDVRGSVEAPPGLKAVQAAIGASTAYAVYPSLVEAKVAVVDAGDSLAGVVAARSVAELYPDLTLMDPYRLVQDAFAAGLGAELAPGWYFAVGSTELPGVLGEVPAGPGVLLEETLLAALKIDDHAALRRTVPGYVDWLRSLEVAALASPDNVLVDGTSYRLFAESEPVDGSGDALVVGQLARFVRRSLAAASREPWAVGSDARDLTARLASMAGIAVTEELWASVADSNEPVVPTGYAEQQATIVRLAEELADASAQASWFESQLDGIRRSRPYRIGQAVLNPARVVVKRVRRTTGR